MFDSPLARHFSAVGGWNHTLNCWTCPIGCDQLGRFLLTAPATISATERLSRAFKPWNIPAEDSVNRAHRQWLLVLPLLFTTYWLRPSHGHDSSLTSAALGRAWASRLAAHSDEDDGVIRKLASVTSAASSRSKETSLGAGGNLASAMERLGLAPATRQSLLRSLGKHLELQRLPAATGLTAVWDGRDELQTLSVRAEEDRFIRLVLEPSQMEAHVEIIQLPLVSRVETIGGLVQYSVAQAFREAPQGHQLTLALSDILQWDVDFLLDPRPGDRLWAVYTVQLLGDAPPDLPHFGKAPCRRGELLGLGRVLAVSYEGAAASATAFWIEAQDGNGDYYDERGRPVRKTFLKSPLNYRRVSSGFSHARLHPITHKLVAHHGVDLAAASGTAVACAADGRVIFAGWAGALGRAIKIRHGKDYVTVYGHLNGFAKGVRTGAEVGQWQVIGYVGATGRATGPHLHYALIARGRYVDPMRFRSLPEKAGAADMQTRLERAKLNWSPLLGSIPASALRGAWQQASDRT